VNPPGAENEPRASEASELTALYREAILRHAAQPVGYRQPIEATHRHELYNAQCGDRIELQLRIEGEQVVTAAFDGEACAICMASASILCSLLPSGPVSELRRLAAALREALHARDDRDPEALPTTDLRPELRPLLGVRRYPSRVQCALLPWSAAREALNGESPAA
jgi:nitrogen fixation NifU-like protein